MEKEVLKIQCIVVTMTELFYYIFTTSNISRNVRTVFGVEKIEMYFVAQAGLKDNISKIFGLFVIQYAHTVCLKSSCF